MRHGKLEAPLVSLFVGSDSYSKQKAIEDLISSLLEPRAQVLDLRVFYSHDADIKEMFDFANTLPFLAPKRVVVVKDLDKLDNEFKALLSGYIQKPSKSTYLVLEAEDEKALKPLNYHSKHVDVRRFDGLKPSEIYSWINRFASSRGNKRIEPEAIEMLKELQGENLISLTQEMEKLFAFVGENPCIKSSDVEEVVGKNLVSSAFSLAGAIERKSANEALTIVSELIMAGKKHYEIIGLLCWHLKRILKAKLLKSEGESDYRIANILKIGRTYRDAFFATAKVFDMAYLQSRMEILLEADLDIKRIRLNPDLVLESALMRLCLCR